MGRYTVTFTTHTQKDTPKAKATLSTTNGWQVTVNYQTNEDSSTHNMSDGEITSSRDMTDQLTWEGVMKSSRSLSFSAPLNDAIGFNTITVGCGSTLLSQHWHQLRLAYPNQLRLPNVTFVSDSIFGCGSVTVEDFEVWKVSGQRIRYKKTDFLCSGEGVYWLIFAPSRVVYLKSLPLINFTRPRSDQSHIRESAWNTCWVSHRYVLYCALPTDPMGVLH